MPYIKPVARCDIDGTGPYPSIRRLPENPGELNYRLTMVILEYLSFQGLSYQTINDINGALAGALTEFNRRVTAPYEDQKIKDNGDVYPQLEEKRPPTKDVCVNEDKGIRRDHHEFSVWKGPGIVEELDQCFDCGATQAEVCLEEVT